MHRSEPANRTACSSITSQPQYPSRQSIFRPRNATLILHSPLPHTNRVGVVVSERDRWACGVCVCSRKTMTKACARMLVGANFSYIRSVRRRLCSISCILSIFLIFCACCSLPARIRYHVRRHLTNDEEVSSLPTASSRATP